MTTYLGKSCSFCLPRVPFVNCRQFMYLVISLLVLRAGYGIWLYQFLIIAYLFTLHASVLCFMLQLVKPMSPCDAMLAAFLPNPRKYLQALFCTVLIFFCLLRYLPLEQHRLDQRFIKVGKYAIIRTPNVQNLCVQWRECPINGFSQFIVYTLVHLLC